MQWLAEVCVKRPVFATMLIMSMVVVGAFSFFSLGLDLFPKIDFPTITITTVNPGSSPVEIETEVTQKIEEAVNTISGIDELRSTSVEGVSQVFVQFVLEKNVNIAAQEVENKVNTIISDLPETVQKPFVQKLDTDAAPVLRLAVSAPASLREVTEVADKKIKERIESINGVGQVRMIGGRDREIQIWVDPDKMRSYNIPVSEVSNAVRLQNLEFPGGRVDEGKTELTVRTMGKVQNVEDFNEVVIANRGGYNVKVKDLGYVQDGVEEVRTEARLNGNPAVVLVISKQSGTNTVTVAEEVKARLAEIVGTPEKPGTLPPGYRVQIVGDSSIFINAAIKSVESHLIEGSILAVIVVFLFLWNFRSTMIAAIAIPTSIIATFGLMYALGYTLNQITMLSLTLMVGIVIDDAIVVLENIFRFIEEKGMSPMEAAVEGTREIGLAVLATTLSLLAVFVPVGFMGGIIGRFMSAFGLTSAFAIFVSLIVSFTLTPMLAARFIKVKHPPKPKMSDEEIFGDGMIEQKDGEIAEMQGESREGRFYRVIDHTYTIMLRFSMAHRWVILGLCVLVTLSTIPLFMLVGKNFLPVDDQAQYEISVRAPEGYTLAATSNLFEKIAADVRQFPEVEDTLTTLGGDAQQVVNSGSIYVKMKPIEQRTRSQEDMMSASRELLLKYPKELRTSVQQVQAFSGGGFRNANVQFFIGGPDLKELEKYSNIILEKMKTVPDAVDVDSTLISGKPELRLIPDRDKAADLGVSIGAISQSLNTLVAGQEVSTFNAGSDQYPVRVRASGEYRSSEEALRRLIVPSTKIGWTTLDNVIKVEQGTGPAAIDRTNRNRQVTLLANAKPGGSQQNIITAINETVADLKLPVGYTAGYVGQSKELQKSAFYFLLAFVLSFVFMYIILAAQFESFIHPVTILLTLPLSVPFAILSLLIMGQSVNIFSGLGILLLFGVVKKNAILQIDHTNQLRERGMNRYDAIIQANRDRLRPILMTTIALVAGMIPLVIATGPGSGTNRSIGVLVVGGQSLCLLLTLLAVPVFYSYFDDLSQLHIFQKIGNLSDRLFGGLRRKIAGATSGLFGKQ
ncbi:MAG: efflux RND transporter permease subunit [Pyrinomonadaceae bacterium]|jgi:HAE1 family hydrophobic/amphiphilic exporter-1|nr:efflux RND transporter permease subunit [Pyrinomonadaceae bacterium]